MAGLKIATDNIANYRLPVSDWLIDSIYTQYVASAFDEWKGQKRQSPTVVLQLF
jgi:hypothetical protein